MFKKYLGVLFVATLFVTVGCQEVDNSLGTVDNVCYENQACDAGLFCQEGVCLETREITTNTIVITTQEAKSELKSGSNEQVLKFVESTRTLKFKTGDILAFQKTDKFPKGLVSKIKSISVNDGLVTTEVVQVSPLEALGEVKIDIKRIVTEDQNSDLFIPNQEEIEAFKNFKKEDVTYSKSKSFPFEKSWLSDVLKVSGSLNFEYLLEAMIDLDYPGSLSEAKKASSYRINEFEVKNTFKLDTNLTVDVFVEKDASFQEIKKEYAYDIAKDISLAEFPIPLPITGIVLTGSINLSVELIPQAHIEGQAHVEATSSNTINANLHYVNGSLNKTFDSESSYHLEEDIKIEGTASITLKLVPTFKITAGVGIAIANFDVASLEFGTEISFTPLKLKATLTQHAEADKNGFGVDAKACFRADAELSINPYALIQANPDYVDWEKKWEKDSLTKVKGWSWLDFMVPGGYFGASSTGCHEGLEDKNGKCRAKEFWSVVGEDDGLKCVQLLCSTDEQCQVNDTTAKDKCIANKCVTPEGANNNGSYELVTISAGSFTRGCVDGDEECVRSETPATSVAMPEYKIGKYEVTVSQYNACVSAGNCKKVEARLNSGDNQPVTNVSWENAYVYCIWVGDLRLPTEAEWEKAAKGSGNNVYVWGADEPTCENTVKADETGDGCGTDSPADVGSKSADASSYGVMDMGGNVSEWVSDYFDPSYYNQDDSLKNPQGPTKIPGSVTYMSVKGGNWFSDNADIFRTSRRDYMQYDKSSDTVGFRCAKTVE